MPINEVPSVFIHPLDAKDSHYIDLALCTRSQLVVGRDKHLLDLVDRTKPAGADFLTRFPLLKIVTPPQFLSGMRGGPRTAETSGDSDES